MRAVLLTGFGGPEALDYRTDVDLPVPGTDEVLIRVTAAALNNTDIWTREGAYGVAGDPTARAGWRGPVAFPRIQGGDITGTVVSTGSEVPTGRIGRRVLVDPALYQDERDDDAPPIGLLGSEADGGFAEYVTVADARAHDVTDSPLSDARLAALPVAYGTALGMLERADVQSGETILVTGASGGVGLALVQLAAARGATVLALTSGRKGDQIHQAGADRVFLREVDGVVDQVSAAAPRGVDVVADVAGGELVAQLMPLLRERGRWVIAGAMAGAVVPFDLRRLYLHNRALIGSAMHTARHFRELADLAGTAGVAPRIAGEYALADLHYAQDQFQRGQHVGKIVVRP